MRLRILHIALCAWIFVSCRSYYQPEFISAHSTNISKETVAKDDSAVSAIIYPYKMALDTIMSQVLVENLSVLTKAKPEGTLNNMFCDVQLELVGNQHKEFSPMFCVMNYGGIRLPSIAAGNITRGKVYELMPFDNEVVIAKIKTSTVKELCDKIAAKGGEPVAGISMTIKANLASDIKINKIPLNDTTLYYVLVSDYMLNGGDGYGFLKEQAVSIHPLNVKVRDVIIGELELMQAKGLKLSAVKDGRIKEVK